VTHLTRHWTLLFGLKNECTIVIGWQQALASPTTWVFSRVNSLISIRRERCIQNTANTPF
jgi:hypothetical protein